MSLILRNNFHSLICYIIRSDCGLVTDAHVTKRESGNCINTNRDVTSFTKLLSYCITSQVVKINGITCRPPFSSDVIHQLFVLWLTIEVRVSRPHSYDNYYTSTFISINKAKKIPLSTQTLPRIWHSLFINRTILIAEAVSIQK